MWDFKVQLPVAALAVFPGSAIRLAGSVDLVCFGAGSNLFNGVLDRSSSLDGVCWPPADHVGVIDEAGGHVELTMGTDMTVRDAWRTGVTRA